MEKSILDLATDLSRECAISATAQRKRTFGTGNFKKKVKSHGLAVHPEQIKEIAEEDKKRVVSVEYNERGQPIFDNSSHFRKYAKAYGLRHMGY